MCGEDVSQELTSLVQGARLTGPHGEGARGLQPPVSCVAPHVSCLVPHKPNPRGKGVGLACAQSASRSQRWGVRARRGAGGQEKIGTAKAKFGGQHTSYPATYYCEAGYKTLRVVSGKLPEKGYGFLRPL